MDGKFPPKQVSSDVSEELNVSVSHVFHAPPAVMDETGSWPVWSSHRL